MLKNLLLLQRKTASNLQRKKQSRILQSSMPRKVSSPMTNLIMSLAAGNVEQSTKTRDQLL